MYVYFSFDATRPALAFVEGSVTMMAECNPKLLSILCENARFWYVEVDFVSSKISAVGTPSLTAIAFMVSASFTLSILSIPPDTRIFEE